MSDDLTAHPLYKEEAPRRNTLRVIYSCALCGLKRVGVDVPERADEQDVVDWMERVTIVAIRADHSARSPKCQAQSIQEIMIPVPDGAKSVGYLPTEN